MLQFPQTLDHWAPSPSLCYPGTGSCRGHILLREETEDRPKANRQRTLTDRLPRHRGWFASQSQSWAPGQDEFNRQTCVHCFLVRGTASHTERRTETLIQSAIPTLREQDSAGEVLGTVQAAACCPINGYCCRHLFCFVCLFLTNSSVYPQFQVDVDIFFLNK